jgi:hypothetical protein
MGRNVTGTPTAFPIRHTLVANLTLPRLGVKGKDYNSIISLGVGFKP